MGTFSINVLSGGVFKKTAGAAATTPPHRVRRGHEQVEPLARGMAAALPYVDEFVEGHSLASLEELAEVIAR